jgi:hypothetical protein
VRLARHFYTTIPFFDAPCRTLYNGLNDVETDRALVLAILADQLVGPLVICLALFIALLVNFILRYQDL